MIKHFNKYLKLTNISIFLDIAALIAISIVGYFLYSFIHSSSQEIITLRNDTSSSTLFLNKKILDLEAALATTTLTGQELTQRLLDEQNKNSYLNESVNNITGTVNTLKKLSQTDKELLQKYSKIYFLNENYVPMQLSNIDNRYLNDPSKTLQFHAFSLPFLESMIQTAKNNGIDIRVVSAYRSFGIQAGLKAYYSLVYGEGANKFSADQGYSEHQLGTTVDLALFGQKVDLEISFEDTTAFDWLNKNAYRYGFILSYPKKNSYYQYEPWHWRFIGVELATKIHNSGMNFSDTEQREIDTYLAKIFD